MQYVDLHWLVYPVYNHDEVKFGLPEIGMFLGFAGLFLFAVARLLSKHSVVAVKDLRISESINHNVTY